MSTNISKPVVSEVFDALTYRPLIVDMINFFQGSHMGGVSTHLKSACKEIDRIWDENDFQYSKKQPSKKQGRYKSHRNSPGRG